ncbi:DNA-methyltransferase [Streptomyces broussonetiae]|uniref:Methyltransferase n=1 Tax=Streptomyces broussonetiae TaxID=2686304 RepID=A0ABV5EJ13_9ACTN
MPRNTILVGDARKRLRELPSASIDCIITSPPYFGVRNYGHQQQLGAEDTVTAWVAELRAVCRELARVLRPAGTLWLNLGDSYSRRPTEGAAQKSLLLGPSRLALALLDDGWRLRNHVIWAKSNPMPTSVTDRLTTTHETVYFFTRSRRYYFNLDAIREPLRTTQKQTTTNTRRTYPPDNARLAVRRVSNNNGLGKLKARGVAGHPLGKNPGDVWSLPTAGFRGAHFATFPLALIERPLLATCPERTCTACGQPWQRERRKLNGRLLANGALQPACYCGAVSAPGIVLDPFFGSGTTALTAEKHGRDWVGIEINPTFAALAEQRLDAARSARKHAA